MEMGETKASLVLMCFALLGFADIVFVCLFIFLQTEGLWPPCVEQVYRSHFSTTLFYFIFIFIFIFFAKLNSHLFLLWPGDKYSLLI